MKELVEVIAKSLVDFPDEVVVTETESEKGTILELRVAQSDMGKVIGKQGRIAKAIRSVVIHEITTLSAVYCVKSRDIVSILPLSIVCSSEIYL